VKVRNWMKYQDIPLQATIINTEDFNFTYYHSMSSTTISTSPTQLSKLQFLSICVHVMHPKRLHPTTSHARYSEYKYLLQRHAVEEY